MIQTKLSGNWGGLGAGSGSLMRRLDMEAIMGFARQDVIARTSRGLGSDDSPMKPLKSSKRFVARDPKNPFRFLGYAAWKVKVGLHGVRDLVGDGSQGGHMWDGCKITLAGETLGRISFTTRHAREKALANEQISPFFGFSPSNERRTVAFAFARLGANIRSLGVIPATAILRKKRMAA